jgi:hypothetical protein
MIQFLMRVEISAFQNRNGRALIEGGTKNMLFIDVPYSEKDEAKSLGWHPDFKIERDESYRSEDYLLKNAHELSPFMIQ